MTKRIEAIETKYQGTLFRSRLEARWSIFLTAHRKVTRWVYEPHTITIEPDPNPEEVILHTYTPDFALEIEGKHLYMEVKPMLPISLYLEMLKEVARATNQPILLTVGSFYYRTQAPKIITLTPTPGPRGTQVKTSKPVPVLEHPLLGHSASSIRLATNYRFDIY